MYGLVQNIAYIDLYIYIYICMFLRLFMQLFLGPAESAMFLINNYYYYNSQEN